MGRQGRRQELWDRLDNEPERCYEAFKCYLYMQPGVREMNTAYGIWRGDGIRQKPGNNFRQWSRDYAWEDRVKAYDAHIEFIRRRGMEQAIEDEARKQTRDAERRRLNLSALMKHAYAATEEFFENVDPTNMRFSDAVQVIRLHIEHVDKFGTGENQAGEETWTEEDDEAIRKAAERVKQRRMDGNPGGANGSGEAEGIQGTEGDRTDRTS